MARTPMNPSRAPRQPVGSLPSAGGALALEATLSLHPLLHGQRGQRVGERPVRARRAGYHTRRPSGGGAPSTTPSRLSRRSPRARPPPSRPCPPRGRRARAPRRPCCTCGPPVPDHPVVQLRVRTPYPITSSAESTIPWISSRSRLIGGHCATLSGEMPFTLSAPGHSVRRAGLKQPS
jgi:hypothetical protein